LELPSVTIIYRTNILFSCWKQFPLSCLPVSFTLPTFLTIKTYLSSNFFAYLFYFIFLKEKKLNKWVFSAINPNRREKRKRIRNASKNFVESSPFCGLICYKVSTTGGLRNGITSKKLELLNVSNDSSRVILRTNMFLKHVIFSCFFYKMKNVIYTSWAQQGYNNPLYGGGSYTLGHTPYEGLLCPCCVPDV
jgi:hypothetical protein